MKRLKLLLGIMAMTALLAGPVALFSPYAPVVQPVMDIEDIWAIEDSRRESDVPLVTRLENHGAALAYDAQENTFYCTLGLGREEAWPDIHLTAPGAKDVQLVFVDDYSYDWCADAIRDGYPYQILAYTDEAFWYFDLVFTGLPLVMIECGQEITDLDTPAQVTFSAFGEEPAGSTANIHLRGGGTRSQEKQNYRVEFTRGENGKKTMIDLPGFGLRENILLNPMVFDETMLRDRMSWAVYGDLLGEDYDGAFGARKTAYAEVFLNDAYCGVYLMMEPMDSQEELLKAGTTHLSTDSVYRTLRIGFAGERPIVVNPTKDNAVFELRYEPAQTRQFAPFEPYLDMLAETDDETFIRKTACMDMESVARYILLRQFTGMDDNVNNNLYIWARQTEDGMKYTFVPWDLDMSWAGKKDNLGEDYECWLAFPLLDRMLVNNAGGLVELMTQRWREWRQDVFTVEHMEQLLNQFSSELENSGARWRNAERWGTPEHGEAVYELSAFAAARIEVLDLAMKMFEDPELDYPPFLSDIDPETDSYSIYGNSIAAYE